MCNQRYCDTCDQTLHPSTYTQVVVPVVKRKPKQGKSRRGSAAGASDRSQENAEHDSNSNEDSLGNQAETNEELQESDEEEFVENEIQTVEVPSSHRRERSKVSSNIFMVSAITLLRLDVILPRLRILSDIPDTLKASCFSLGSPKHQRESLTATTSKPLRRKWSTTKTASPVPMLEEDSLDEMDEPNKGAALSYLSTQRGQQASPPGRSSISQGQPADDTEHMAVFCEVHVTSLVQYYCLTCEARLCNKCIREEPHNQSQELVLSQAASKSPSLGQVLQGAADIKGETVQDSHHTVLPLEAVFWPRTALLWCLAQTELRPRFQLLLALQLWCRQVQEMSTKSVESDAGNSLITRTYTLEALLQQQLAGLTNAEARVSAVLGPFIRRQSGTAEFLSTWRDQISLSTSQPDDNQAEPNTKTNPIPIPALPQLYVGPDSLPCVLSTYPWAVSRATTVFSGSGARPRTSSPFSPAEVLDIIERYFEAVMSTIDSLLQATSFPMDPYGFIKGPQPQTPQCVSTEQDILDQRRAGLEQLAQLIAAQTAAKLQQEMTSINQATIDASLETTSVVKRLMHHLACDDTTHDNETSKDTNPPSARVTTQDETRPGQLKHRSSLSESYTSSKAVVTQMQAGSTNQDAGEGTTPTSSEPMDREKADTHGLAHMQLSTIGGQFNVPITPISDISQPSPGASSLISGGNSSVFGIGTTSQLGTHGGDAQFQTLSAVAEENNAATEAPEQVSARAPVRTPVPGVGTLPQTGSILETNSDASIAIAAPQPSVITRPFVRIDSTSGRAGIAREPQQAPPGAANSVLQQQRSRSTIGGMTDVRSQTPKASPTVDSVSERLTARKIAHAIRSIEAAAEAEIQQWEDLSKRLLQVSKYVLSRRQPRDSRHEEPALEPTLESPMHFASAARSHAAMTRSSLSGRPNQKPAVLPSTDSNATGTYSRGVEQAPAVQRPHQFYLPSLVPSNALCVTPTTADPTIPQYSQPVLIQQPLHRTVAPNQPIAYVQFQPRSTIPTHPAPSQQLSPELAALANRIAATVRATQRGR